MTAHIRSQELAAALIALGGSSGVDPGALAVASIVQTLLGIGVYVWTALALTAVFRKVGVTPWKAWVPVLNIWELFVLAGMRGWWAAVLAGGAILVGIISTVIAGLFTAAALNAGFGGDAGSAAGALAAAVIIPALIWLAFAVFVVILEVRMLRAVNRGFGLGTAYTVLGVLLFPVWASIVGWGSAQWRGTETAAAEGPFRRGTAAVADVPTPPASSSTTSSPPPAAAAPGSGPFAPPPAFPAASDAPPPPPAAAEPVSASPWAPPPPPAEPAAAPAAPQPWVSAPAAAPAAAPVAAAPVAAPTPAAVPADDLDERTVLAARRGPQASLRLPDGTTVVLASDVAVLGRNPLAPAAAPEAQPVPIDDVTRTISKTHALLRRTPEGWRITDLASTNGVFVGADESEVSGSAVVTDVFHLGDAELHLVEGE
ncbi:FHA domain-containing protein [Microbacterium thalli]|uniref:FHA domain-containing protein n=1 Tax=Microbacterium thalli TaxID=3027921 RepID=UPI0023664FA1|nr:DUF5684 domain-containing protein [Microbacterium thalli]MDD7929422.1 DUF5684 domain-containing protein [Microbacterium thalli]